MNDQCFCDNVPKVWRLTGVTRTLRLRIFNPDGTPCDLTGRDVVVTVSRDNSDFAYAPGFVVEGDNHNVIKFSWAADKQGAGDYTITATATDGSDNVDRVNWHGPTGIRLVDYSYMVKGSDAEGVESDSEVGLEGTYTMNGTGMSAYEEWLASDESTGYPHTVVGFMAYLKQPATDAAEAAEATMTEIQSRADDDHTTAESDHTRAGSDHTTATGDHTRAEEDHQFAFENRVLAYEDHLRAEGDHTTAAADHTTAQADHATAGSDHTRAEADHTTAASDHSTAASDHTKAGQDSTRAGSDHDIAVADHAQAEADHTRAESDHTTAAADHTTAAADHTIAASDHTTAAADHTQAVADHAVMAGYDTRLTNVETDVTQLGQEVTDLIQPADTDDDFDISDGNGNIIVRFRDGEVQTKEFDSAKAPQGESANGYDLALSDENGKHIALFAGGEVRTKNFDSSLLKTGNNPDTDFAVEDEEGNAIIGVIDGYPVTKNFNGKAISDKVDKNEEDIEDLKDAVPVIDSVYGWKQLDPNNPLSKIRFDAGLTPVIQHWGFIGDSLSSGCHGYDTGVGTATGVDIYDYSWGQFICRLCGTEGYNFSFGGGAAKTWLTNNDRGWPKAQQSDYFKQAYTLAFGINDAVQIQQETTMYPDGLGDADVDLVVDPLNPYDYSQNNEDTFVGCSGGIIQRLRSVNPRCRVFVLTMLDKNYNSMPIHLSMDAEIRKIAAKFDDVYCIDLATYAPQYYGSPLHDVLVYWSHLTSVGYVWLAYLINTYIDWIIRQNLYAFRDIALIGTDKYMNQNIH